MRHITDAGPISEVAQWCAEKCHCTPLVGEQPEQCTDQGLLSGTVAAHQGHRLARVYREVDAAQHRKSATFDRQVVGLQYRTCSYEHPPAFRSAAKLADMTDR